MGHCWETGLLEALNDMGCIKSADNSKSSYDKLGEYSLHLRIR